MKRQQVTIKSWNRFHTRNLVVDPEVLGKEHCFPFENSTISIRIPTAKQVDRGHGYDEVASAGARQSIDNEPVEVVINKVDLEVSFPIRVLMSSEVLNRNANAYDLFSEKEQEQLNNIAEQHQLIAEKAFDYWIRIVRWVCDDSRIGREWVDDFHTGWSTYLIDTESETKVWIQSQMLSVVGYRRLNIEEWREIQFKLSAVSIPPIYVELKHDAEEHLNLGDYRRSLIDLVIACETFLRFTVLKGLPEELNPKLVAYIETANISQYVNQFFPEVINEAAKKEYQKLKSDLKSLFARRNKLVHMGNDSGINEELCLRFLRLTQELLSIKGI